MSVQIVNTPHPNSIDNISVFSVFEAHDTVTNLHTALDRYKDQVTTLQTISWREKKFRVFLFGDYEFLGKAYGISGASGRHCCLYCEISTENMQTPLKDRGHSASRTLASLERDYLLFTTKGKGNLKNAKFYNNAIHKPFFNIPIVQAVLPGLHISLGIFMKLWHLMERECHKLDLELAQATRGKSDDRKEFLSYSALIHEISNLEEEKIKQEDYARSLDMACTSIALQLGDEAEQNTLLRELCKEAVHAHDTLEATEKL